MPRSKLPDKWNPNSSLTEYEIDGKGKRKRKRRRFYGGDGRAVKNIDYLPHHGHPAPHAHDWDWTKPAPRGPARSLRPGE